MSSFRQDFSAFSTKVAGIELPSLIMCCAHALLLTRTCQESGLLNRPEIPHLAGLNKPLLVKAYDLGLIDARGSTESSFISERLALAESQVRVRVRVQATVLNVVC